MKQKLPRIAPQPAASHIEWLRRTLLGILFISVIGCLALSFVLYTVSYQADLLAEGEGTYTLHKKNLADGPFPVSVDPVREVILENPTIEAYLDGYLPEETLSYRPRGSWFSRTIERIAGLGAMQNLASPVMRTLVIRSGERKEEIADSFARVLGWSSAERGTFLSLVTTTEPEIVEGKFAPGKYTTVRKAPPEEVAMLVLNRFDEDIASRYTDQIESQVPLSQALTVASLLEREAYDFEDMRYISGIIWNRLFADMRLQLDATLQYAKGSRPTGPWWPRVVPADKYIASPFNTYEHEGLPPAPIANPSAEAVLAALNPRKTDCMFYFHDKKGGFHCSVTYEEHVVKLKEQYGRGK